MYHPALTSHATAAAIRTARALIPANIMAFLLLSCHSAHLADELPFVGGHRLHRQAALFHQHHVFELRLRLDGGERHRLRQCLDRAGGHGDPGLTLLGGRVGKGLAEDFADADDLFLVAGVIEEKFLTLLHRLQMFARREIAHAAPRLALLAALDLVIPGKFLRLRLHQPIRHRHSSAFVSLSPRAGRGWGEGAYPLGSELRGISASPSHRSAMLRIAERPPHPRSLRSLDLSPHAGRGYFIPPPSTAASAKILSPRPMSSSRPAAPRRRPRSACRPSARAPCRAAPAR